MSIITEPFAICNREKTKKVILKNNFLSLNIPPLLPDELDYSFFMRTCIRNAYPNLTKFVNALLGRYDDVNIRHVRLDGIRNEYDEIFEIENGEKFSECTSILSVLTIFMNESAKKKTENISSNTNMRWVRPLLDCVQICPECAENDRKRYGTVYFHRAHCIPGVTVCYEHGCALEKQTWKMVDGEESIMPNVSETCTPLPRAVKYADFAKKFVDSAMFFSNITKEDIQYLLHQRLMEKTDGFDISYYNPTKEETAAYSSRGEIDFDIVLQKHSPIEFTTGMLLLVKTFDTPERFFGYALKHLNEKSIMKDFSNTVPDGNGFTFERVVSRNGIRYAEFKHDSCGQTFWRGISEMYTRAGKCPYCSAPKMTKEKFREEFEKKYGGRFTLLNEYNSNARALKVKIDNTDIVLNDRPGAMKARLDWLMEDSEELNRIIETGVVRNIIVEKEKMMTFINEHFNEDEPFLSSSLPSSPDLHIITKKLCDRGVIYRLATGVYCRTLIELSDDELIDLKYIRNKDRRYGFDLGDRFLREVVPHCQVNPKERFIVTSPTHAVMYHDSKVQVGKITCNVYRSDEEITEDNWKVLALVLFFRHEKACTVQREDHYIPLLALWAVSEGITEEQIRNAAFSCAARTRSNVARLMKEVKSLWLARE